MMTNINVPLPPPPDAFSHVEVIAWVGGIVAAAFAAGATVKARLTSVFGESLKEVKDDMSTLTSRIDTMEKSYVTKHEAETLRKDALASTDRLKEVHDKDMDKMFLLFTELKTDIKEGFAAVSSRIDSFVPLLIKKNNE